MRLSAVDYLLKPIDEKELKTAITRLRKRVSEKSKNHSPKKEKNHSNRLALITAEGIYIVDKAQIIRVDAMSNYSVFILDGSKKIVVSKTLKEFETILEEDFFLRVSRSAIINLTYVSKYIKGNGGTIELSDGSQVEVSPQKKDALLQRLF